MQILTTLGLIFGYMTLWWIIALLRKRNDLADIAWGLGFILISIFSQNDLIKILVMVWGLRLAGHIYFRNQGKQEDFRYKKWREDWGKNWIWRTYLQVFLLQGGFMFLISLPIQLAGKQLNWVNFGGAIIWLVGFYFETVGDWQLTKFKQNPTNKGKILTTGLWQYTRHPNYFGEVTMWWGIWLISFNQSWWLSLLGPLTISWLILKVSGIPLLEKKYQGRKDWEEYKSKTKAFFPGLTR